MNGKKYMNNFSVWKLRTICTRNFQQIFPPRKFISSLFPCLVTRGLPYKLAKMIHDSLHVSLYVCVFEIDKRRNTFFYILNRGSVLSSSAVCPIVTILTTIWFNHPQGVSPSSEEGEGTTKDQQGTTSTVRSAEWRKKERKKEEDDDDDDDMHVDGYRTCHFHPTNSHHHHLKSSWCIEDHV